MRWLESTANAAGRGRHVALDGKSLRRNFDGPGGRALHVVSALATGELSRVLGQVAVEKSNEIEAIPELLRLLGLPGAVVTIDAMGCHKAIAAQITAQGGDYLLALKANHPVLHADTRCLFADEATLVARKAARAETLEKDHGRIETRRYFQSAPLDWFAERGAWEGLQSVGVVEATREINGKVSVERRYYLSSSPMEVALFARAVRGHWAVENNLHWMLDVVFAEDQSRARVGFAVANLGTARRLALNLLRQDKTPNRSVKRKQRRAAFDPDCLASLLKF